VHSAKGPWALLQLLDQVQDQLPTSHYENFMTTANDDVKAKEAHVRQGSTALIDMQHALSYVDVEKSVRDAVIGSLGVDALAGEDEYPKFPYVYSRNFKVVAFTMQ
jgi:hypothetical protein